MRLARRQCSLFALVCAFNVVARPLRYSLFAMLQQLASSLGALAGGSERVLAVDRKFIYFLSKHELGICCNFRALFWNQKMRELVCASVVRTGLLGMDLYYNFNIRAQILNSKMSAFSAHNIASARIFWTSK